MWMVLQVSEEPDPQVGEVAKLIWLKCQTQQGVSDDVGSEILVVFRIALRTALQEAVLGQTLGEVAPSLVSHVFLKAPHEWTIGKDKLVKRFQLSEGQFRFSVQCAAELANVRRRSRRPDTDSEAKRGEGVHVCPVGRVLLCMASSVLRWQWEPRNSGGIETAICAVPRSVVRVDQAQLGTIGKPPLHWFFRLGEHLVNAEVSILVSTQENMWVHRRQNPSLEWGRVKLAICEVLDRVGLVRDAARSAWV